MSLHACLHIVLRIGLQQDVYEVYENASLATVCIELLEGCACHRPVNARLYTEDGNATGNMFGTMHAYNIISIHLVASQNSVPDTLIKS